MLRRRRYGCRDGGTILGDARRFGDFVEARDGGSGAARPRDRRGRRRRRGASGRLLTDHVRRRLVHHARHGHAAVVVTGDGFISTALARLQRAASAMDVDQPMEIPAAPRPRPIASFCRAFSPSLRRVVRKATEHGLVAGPSDDLPAASRPRSPAIAGGFADWRARWLLDAEAGVAASSPVVRGGEAAAARLARHSGDGDHGGGVARCRRAIFRWCFR